MPHAAEPTVERARRLRREGTDVERAMWAILRDRRLAGSKFRRQHPIGPFVADFACLDARLVVELDGGQHAEHPAADAARTGFLESRGLRVLRFWNNEVLTNREGVLTVILEAVAAGKGDGK
jgi:very-short-patch-repair endonuclease